MAIRMLMLYCVLLCVSKSKAQLDTTLKRIDKSISSLPELPNKYFGKVTEKVNSFSNKLTRKSEKYLKKLQRQEQKLIAQLQQLNPDAAKQLLEGATSKYSKLSEQFKSKTAILAKITGGQYSSYLDTLCTSLSFLKQFDGITDKVKAPLAGLAALQTKLAQTEKIKQFIAERKSQLKEVLSKYGKLPKGLKTKYEKLSKTAYYYSAQIREYKAVLQDPNKIEQKAIGLLNKLPAFQKFMKENSQLASLFRTNGDRGTASSIAGLQTRAAVQDLIQQRISSGGPNAMAQVQQNLAQAHSEINQLKDKANRLGGGSGDIDMPDFKPNQQKTKSFLKRLEFGSNIQFGKTNKYIPNGADIGLSVGYKLNEKSIIGIGGSYKMGIGNIRRLNITHNGIGLRSFLDYKIKKQFFLSGGFEMNYNAQFKNIEVLKDRNAWQQAGLLGLSKKYKISKKVKGNMQLLFDFLSRDHQPISQPFIYRIGYTIK